MGGDVVVNSRAIAATEVIEPAVHNTICLYLKKGEVIMIYGINHIAISTPNLERLAAFYCEQLGFDQVFTVNWDIGNVAYDNIMGLRNSSARGLILKLGNAFIELFEYRTPTPRLAAAMRPESDHGITRVCLQVTDIVAEYERLRANGMQFHSPPQTVGSGIWAVHGRDPDGNVVELLETPADSSLAVVPARLAPAASPSPGAQTK